MYETGLEALSRWGYCWAYNSTNSRSISRIQLNQDEGSNLMTYNFKSHILDHRLIQDRFRQSQQSKSPP
jgi:hypothetical protein